MKKNLSKQSIFTILGLLVIIGSIPVAVLLVQQRQEIRKEAASWDGTRCAQTDQAECTDWGNPATAYCANKCGGGTTTTTTTTSTSTVECTTWDSVNCRGCANGKYGPTCGDYGPGGADGAAAWCACEKKCGGGVISTNCGGTANPGTTNTTGTTTTSSTTCTPGTWSSSLCTRCTASGEWPQGGIACPAGNLDFGSQNKDGDAGYTDAAHCDCQRRCWGAANMTTNCGGPIPIENAPGNESTAGNTSRSWGLYKTGVSCGTSFTPTPTPTLPLTPTPTSTLTPTPTPTVTVTPTPTPTSTLTPTPTPTTTVGCNISCSSNSNCNNGLICSSGYCRNGSCTGETSCNCPGPTSTPTPGPTSTPTPTGTIVTATPTPVVSLPTAGFTLPTFGAVFGGALFVILASALFLL